MVFHHLWKHRDGSHSWECVDLIEEDFIFFETHFDGGRHPHYGRFLKLVPDELIEMTWVTGDPGTLGAETVITLELTPQNDGTLVKLTHAGFTDEKIRDGHAEAWPMALAILDERMAETE